MKIQLPSETIQCFRGNIMARPTTTLCRSESQENLNNQSRQMGDSSGDRQQNPQSRPQMRSVTPDNRSARDDQTAAYPTALAGLILIGYKLIAAQKKISVMGQEIRSHCGSTGEAVASCD